MTLTDQRYVMGIFCPHVLVPWSQTLSKLRRLAFLLSIVAIFGGVLAYTYILYSSCNGTDYIPPTGATDNLDGTVFLAYIILCGWGIEFYRNGADEAAWILIWRRLVTRPHRTSEILAYIKASVFGGDPDLSFFFHANLTWQDRLLEICRYLGVFSIFIGLVLLALARDTSFAVAQQGLVCEFHLTYWIVSCCLFALALIPIFAAAIVQMFTIVPPLTPHAAAVSLRELINSLGKSGYTVDDGTYIERAKQCRCYWQVSSQKVGDYRYPVFIHVGPGCNCPINDFAAHPIPSIYVNRGPPHWLYLLLATGIAASLIGAYILSQKQIGKIYYYDTVGQVWAIAVTFFAPQLTSCVVKDMARNRFMYIWAENGVSAGYVAVSTRVWGSGAEWIWTALLFPEHRRFGWLALWAYASGFWVMLTALWMAFDDLISLGDPQTALHVVYGNLIFGFIVSCAVFYRLKKYHNYPVSVFKPQPLKVIRWIMDSIELDRRRVPRTILGTEGYEPKRLVARESVNRLEIGEYI
jgi:hypothetical protein